jgi:hypothetical protein
MQNIQLYILLAHIEHKRLVRYETNRAFGDIYPYIVSNLGLIPLYQITSLNEKTGSFYMLMAQSSSATTTAVF